MTQGGDSWYSVEKLFITSKTTWPTTEIDESNPLFIGLDSSGTEWKVDASRMFAKKRDAVVEANNLNEFARRVESMGHKWPHEEVSEAGALMPETVLTVKVVSGEETETRNGKYCIRIDTKVMEPKANKNSPYRINFVIGTDDDMEAEEDSTWTSSFAASRYKSFLKAADAPETGDIEEELESLAGVVMMIDNGHSADGKYNDPRAFYRRGERDEGEAEEAKPAKAKPSTKPAKGKPAKKQEPDDDFEDE